MDVRAINKDVRDGEEQMCGLKGEEIQSSILMYLKNISDFFSLSVSGIL